MSNHLHQKALQLVALHFRNEFVFLRNLIVFSPASHCWNHRFFSSYPVGLCGTTQSKNNRYCESQSSVNAQLSR